MKRIFVAAALTLAMAGAALAQNIGGTYKVEGKNPSGSTYFGTARITVTSQNTCRIEWNVGSTSRGICMRNGSSFAASYILGKDIGLVIYRLNSDGVMEGLWTIADQSGVGTEMLIPSR